MNLAICTGNELSKITSDNFNRKEFFKQLIDDDILEIVSTDEADEYDEADDLSKYLGDG